jgi:hypothetical protein
MEQLKRWADYVCMCTFYLPASLSASEFQGAGRQNPVSSQSSVRPHLLFLLLFLKDGWYSVKKQFSVGFQFPG